MPKQDLVFIEIQLKNTYTFILVIITINLTKLGKSYNKALLGINRKNLALFTLIVIYLSVLWQKNESIITSRVRAFLLRPMRELLATKDA